jgi:hypothetical protein
MIVGAIGLYGERVEQALVGIKRLQPHVDRYVVIVDESVNEEQKKLLKEAGCEVYFHKWEDSMVKMRNQYLNKIQTGDWALVHDPDEWFNENFCRDAKTLCMQAEQNGFHLLLINSHDCTLKEDGSKDESVSTFFKNLIFHKTEGTQYEGVGEVKEVHEQLIIPGLTKAFKLPNEKYWYEHTKYWWEVWERAARNVFLAGGGNNVGERNTSWKPLRRVCDELGLKTWPQAREYLRKGKVDIRLIQWLWDNRYEGFDYQHEMMEFGRWYFEYLHSDEAANEKGEKWAAVTELEKGSPAEVMHYVEETYLQVLGRHADQPGKEAYTKAILEGRLKREDLANHLKQSREYQEKFGGGAGSEEKIAIKVPVDVQVRLTEVIIGEALLRSKIFWQKVKPRLDLGSFVETALGEKQWTEFTTWFYDTKPGLKEFIEKLGNRLD